MITNFLKSGFQSFETITTNIASLQNNQSTSNNKTTTQNNNPPIPIDKIVDQTIAILVEILSQKLGEKIQTAEIKQLTTDVMKSKSLENSLIQTKQRYNDLVNKSTNLYQQARRISNCIGEFITSINLFLESEELLIPLKEIQKGINELQPQRVEKQFSYLIKIFTNNFQQVIDKNVKIVENNMGEEIKLLKNLNKNLEQEIIATKNNKNNDESRYLQQAMKITALNQKIAKMIAEKNQSEKEQKVGSSVLQQKVRIINEQEKEISRMKQRQGELLQKIKQLDLKSTRFQRQFKQHNNETQALNTIIQKLKVRQEQIVQQIQAESQKKDAQHQALRKKLYNQKVILEEKNQQLKENLQIMQKSLASKQVQLQKLKKQLTQIGQSRLTEIDIEQLQKKQEKMQEAAQNQQFKDKQQEITQTERKKKMTINEIFSRIKELEKENTQIRASLAKQRQLGVNKQVLKSLFIGYDDQSKEWNVKRNIKYQIYSLLDMKDKLPKPQQPKSGKWFGFF